MKYILLFALAFFTMSAHAWDVDTVKTKRDTTKKHGYHIFFDKDKRKEKVESALDTTPVKEHSKAPGFSIGITLARLDLGLATLVDNGSFTLSPQNSFLSYRSWKTSNVGFDVAQMGYRFSSGFRIYTAVGFDWTLIRLRQNITILPSTPVLSYRVDNIDYSKNRFSASYLRVPLTFELRSHEDASGHSFKFDIGPEFGLLIDGRVKQISAENGKQKFDNGYHFAKWRYGGVARVGYGPVGIFGKYYFNDMFQDSPAQAGLKNFSFGLMLGF
ncbi:outer membrane beta-barrel protein [Mucilaginibacter ginkgonis]|uniref:PorT family protein n=1 Tax=Mucilaginibacter ginkgonis TaxID=2682091 RepID=A0A6I4IP65_9SPHI|nr:PorT family protein [Mucilaginibacter ginkgonis]QQL49113.1 PorT family protein [Mucilaginibacter ginkgonis]